MTIRPKEDILRAFKTAMRNGCMRCNSEEDLLFYAFMQGMVFQSTGVAPKKDLES